ncbi:MAG TPA: hypothetical protein VFV31_03100 [Chitinophagaceae bacterium]|nr:hypothetical protein [Chitinophagaceae bacterium]
MHLTNFCLQRIASFLSVIIILFSCSKKDSPAPTDPCRGVSYDVQYFKTESIGTSNNGTITINFPVGDTITYKLNSGSYQASPIFNNLAPGNYVVTVKNQKGCTDTAQITILNYGPKYALVKQIIVGYCGPCHRNGGNDGGKNFDTDASIVASWDRIKARAVDATPSQMPQAPNAPLTAPDKQKIVDWVNAGHRQSD